MRIHSLAIAVAGLVGLFGVESLACSCFPLGSGRDAAQAAFDGTSAVFRGKVLSVRRFTENNDQFRQITYEVSQSWKGATSSRVEVATADDSATCGIYGEVGEEYVVFASEPDEGEIRSAHYLANLCNGTRAVGAVPPDWFAFLADQPELPLTPHSGCSSTGFGVGLLPLLALGRMLRRKRG